eukprot:1004915-Amphidinium_carterae.1
MGVRGLHCLVTFTSARVALFRTFTGFWWRGIDAAAASKAEKDVEVEEHMPATESESEPVQIRIGPTRIDLQGQTPFVRR